MVVYSLQKNASQIRQQVANSLVEICKSSLEYEEELNIEGMVCITMDKQHVLPIPFNIQLQKKPVRHDGSGDSATSIAANKETPVLPPGLVFPPGTTISAPDLQSAQAALQSLLNKTAAEASSSASGEANAQPEFISLSDMVELEEEEEMEGNKAKKVNQIIRYWFLYFLPLPLPRSLCWKYFRNSDGDTQHSNSNFKVMLALKTYFILLYLSYHTF